MVLCQLVHDPRKAWMQAIDESDVFRIIIIYYRSGVRNVVANAAGVRSAFALVACKSSEA